MKEAKQNVMVIGAGSMGKAIAASLVRAKLFGKVTLTVRNETRRKEVGPEISGSGIRLRVGNTSDLDNADIIIIAVKPQSIDGLCQELAEKVKPGVLLISIAAGVDIKSLVDGFKHQRVVRCMPNTALTVGHSITTWMAAFGQDDEATRELCQKIFQPWGMEQRVDNERYLDMATAIFGTGPALIYHFINEFYDAAVHIGFPKSSLRKMILEMVIGAVELAKKNKERHLVELVNQVTSPGGTTAEALYIFKEGGLGAIVTKAVKAAFDKAVKLH